MTWKIFVATLVLCTLGTNLSATHAQTPKTGSEPDRGVKATLKSSRQAQAAETKLITPVDADYSNAAFYPERWEEAGLSFKMTAWEGKHVVFLTKSADHDPKLMTAFVNKLDLGWEVYANITGVTPQPVKLINEKCTICALPKPNLSCGYGCGRVGSTGIEVSAFYKVDLPMFKRNQKVFPHYYFYEFGRNFYVFRQRHSLFVTGYAVFMRYVCLDLTGTKTNTPKIRETIERCEQIYANSDLGFYEVFTNVAGKREKEKRLTDKDGNLVRPSGQPVMYASAMLKLRKDNGGDEWVKKFYHHVLKAPARRADDVESAQAQCLSWLVCASAAASKDLTKTFADRWRMPLTGAQRKLMKATDWKGDVIPVKALVLQLLELSDRTKTK